MNKEKIFLLMSCLAGQFGAALFGANAGADLTDAQKSAEAKRAKRKLKRKEMLCEQSTNQERALGKLPILLSATTRLSGG